MKLQKQSEHNTPFAGEPNTRFDVEALETRLNYSVAVDVIGLATVDLHLDLQATVTTPVGVNVDLALTL